MISDFSGLFPFFLKNLSNPKDMKNNDKIKYRS